MRMIPGKTKVKIELFKKVTLADMLLGVFAFVVLVLIFTSSLPFKFYIAGVHALISIFLFVRIDEEPNYIYALHILRFFGFNRNFENKHSDDELFTIELDEAAPEIVEESLSDLELKAEQEGEFVELDKKAVKKRSSRLKGKRLKRRAMEEIIGFTEITESVISYGGKYYGAVIEIPPVEFRFFTEMRRNMAIEQVLGKILRNISLEYSANIVKLERPVLYESYLEKEYEKLDSVTAAYENGLVNENELKARTEVIYDRIHELRTICYDDQIINPAYYVVLYEADRRQLEMQINTAIETLSSGEMSPHRLNNKEIALFLRYSNEQDFDENEINKVEPQNYAKWAMPRKVDITPRRVEVNDVVTHNFRIVNYPVIVGDAWLAGVFSMPSTKCVIKCKPLDRAKAMRAIDRSLEELRDRYRSTGVDSRRMELQTHIETLAELLNVLQQENENLLQVNIYISAYDITASKNTPALSPPERSSLTAMSSMKKTVRRTYQESSLRLNNMEFDQVQAFIGSQINGFDPFVKEGRGIPSNTVAGTFPWIYSSISDVGGLHYGSSDGVPVFIDFFRRDSERLNSNMVIVGKSGSGKSYAAKSLLANLAADDSKIFILDPENEYAELAQNLNGKFINVGNAQQGRLNPFHVITGLDDDESDTESVTGSYSTHLQFLEEFFKQILPDCDKDALEYLNSLVDRTYRNKGISVESNLSKLHPEDYPVFDDLYDVILMEFQQTSNEYIRSMLRVLMNYIAKFSSGGRNSNIWNGKSTITTEENFIVFNFQSLLANRNMTVANAQMLLVLKYIDNEIIKNRDYNRKHNVSRKVIVVIDEAHVFIDTKYPAALDFMFQLAKRIRKYNGMQIVITQNIKDFVGSEEIIRKSTGIINACQYSLIFALAPNDMQDLCLLYEKAGGINEQEQDQIVSAPRGHAFAILGPASRTSFRVDVPSGIQDLFSNPAHVNGYFAGEEGQEVWEGVVAQKRKNRLANGYFDKVDQDEGIVDDSNKRKPAVTFIEVEDEADMAIMPSSRPYAKEQALLAMQQAEQAATAQATANAAANAATQAAANAAATMAAQVAVAQNMYAPMQNQGTGVEKILSELVDKFRYDAMQDEIKRAVKAEMESSYAYAAKEPPATVSGSASSQEDDTLLADMKQKLAHLEDTEKDDILLDNDDDSDEDVTASEFAFDANGDYAYDSADDSEYVDGTEGAEDDDDTDYGEDEMSFDINALLSAQAEKIQSLSPIDMMSAYGSDCIEVTLDELQLYNTKRK